MEIDLKDLRGRLTSYVSRNLLRSDAEDIVQQAFLNCYQSSAFTKEKTNFAYLVTVCRNIVRNRNDDETIELQTERLSGLKTLEDEVFTNIDKGYIRYSMSALAEIDIKILRLRYFNASSFKSIACRRQMNINTVLTRHRRALDTLRPTLLDYFQNNSIPRKYQYSPDSLLTILDKGETE